GSSPEALRKKAYELKVQRAAGKDSEPPPPHEIESGQALNVLFFKLQSDSYLRDMSKAISIPQDCLALINFTSGQMDQVGLLRRQNIFWEFVLRQKEFDDDRNQIDKLLAEVKGGVMAGKPLDVDKINSLQTILRTMERKLVARTNAMSTEEFVFSDYSSGKEQLRNLTNAVKGLKNEQAKDFLSGKLSARGITVQEFIQDMLNKGLLFAPATTAPAKEAYRALWHSLARAVAEGPKARP